MTRRTSLSCVALVALAASACGLGSDDEPHAASDSALGVTVGPPTDGPPARLPPPHPIPPQPPPPTDPLYVDDPSSIAIIQRDSDAFWNAWFAYVDDAADIQAGFAGDAAPYWETPSLWAWQERIDALVQMYDLLAPIDRGRAARYLERLRVMANALLANRDDVRHAPLDYFRGRVMPGWGARTRDRDDQWLTDVVIAGNFAYAMAAFARRVADDPSSFCTEYLNDAVRFTIAAAETYIGYHDENLHFGADAWAYYTNPIEFGDLRCDDPDDDIRHACNGYKSRAGKEVSFNENLSMMRALSELALAANSALYRDSTADSPANKYVRLFYATNDAPLLIAKEVAWFRGHLTEKTWSNGARYWQWQHEPGGYIQNTAHGGFELGSLAVIARDKPRLDALLAANGHAERVPVDATMLTGFANTFLLRIWNYDPYDVAYQNLLAENVDGSGNESPTKNANEGCAGFAPLAELDPWVWVRCRDATYKQGPAGNYLRVGNHAALLRYRQGPTSNPGARPVVVPVLCSPTVALTAAAKISRR